MKKVFVFIMALGLTVAHAAPVKNKAIQSFDDVAGALTYWDDSNWGDNAPVYYGQVTTPKGGHHACLLLAFFKAEDGVIHYAHKMWPKNKNGCDYQDTDTLKVDNSTVCVPDSSKAKKGILKTTLMTKQNIKVSDKTVFRTLDLNINKAGQQAPCYGHKAADVKAGKHGQNYMGRATITGLTVTNGRFKLTTSYPLVYDVKLEPLAEPPAPNKNGVY